MTCLAAKPLTALVYVLYSLFRCRISEESLASSRGSDNIGAIIGGPAWVRDRGPLAIREETRGQRTRGMVTGHYCHHPMFSRAGVSLD